MNTYELDREDVILLLLDTSVRLLGSPTFKGITRLEKLVFLLTKEGGNDVAGLFHFTPYKFGPFSKDVYECTEFLRGLGLLDVSERSIESYYATAEEEELFREISDSDESAAVGAREKIFQLTENGNKVATRLRQIWSSERPQDLSKIEEIVTRYAGLPLNQIIRHVYGRYPAMATKSIHPEARKLSH